MVAGGSNSESPSLDSLEFFDLSAMRWFNLGRMRQGRRFPGVSTVANKLVVSGECVRDGLGS